MRSNFWDEENGVFEVGAGAEVGATIAEAIEKAKNEQRSIAFKFNDVVVEVDAESNPSLIYRDWQRNMNGYITGRVGPHPSARLTSAELAHDAEVEAKNEARRAASQAKYAAEIEAKKVAANDRLEGSAPITIADQDAWDKTRKNNPDGYGGAVVSYAERWARLMQVGIAEGKRVEDIAQATSSEADIEGITGFMYGAAVSILSKCWIHGEALRRWHNKDYGKDGARANDSGGVINPAILTIR